MFVIKQTATYSWPVKFEVPGDAGKFETQTFDAVFKRMPQSQMDEMIAGSEGAKDSDIARQILVGWSGITDGETDVPFSESMRDKLLDVPGVGTAIVAAFLSSLQGAKRKN